MFVYKNDFFFGIKNHVKIKIFKNNNNLNNNNLKIQKLMIKQ